MFVINKSTSDLLQVVSTSAFKPNWIFKYVIS